MWARVLGRGGFEPPKALGQLIYSQSRLTASVSARPGDFTDNRPMGKRRWILWQGLVAPSMERFIAARTESGFKLSGLLPKLIRMHPMWSATRSAWTRAGGHGRCRSRARM